jgi:hypothetical protein
VKFCLLSYQASGTASSHLITFNIKGFGIAILILAYAKLKAIGKNQLEEKDKNENVIARCRRNAASGSYQGGH